jgi:hypothetical protein
MSHLSLNKIKFLLFSILFFIIGNTTNVDAFTLTSGNNATTTPNIATAITGFQIVGNAASTTPVKLFSTSGTLAMSTVTGLTFDGSQTGSVIYFSGTVANINTALSTLTYTRASTGTDTLEVSLVPQGEAFFTTNSHLYKFISGAIDWNDAFTAAQTQTAYGVSGYLVTITSSDENSFVSGRLTGDGWIGGSDTAVEDVWRWVSGPEAGINFWNGTDGGSSPTYASWAGGEPNQSGEEDCAQTYVASGNWNDYPCDATLDGYVVEFGTDGNLPAVVATNISVVTADVPAITSLSPTNGSLTATANQNLVIGFSKNVSTSTGNILIKKTSDNTLVESIAVTSSQITGGGTNTITINPSTTLTEGVNYYITVPNTAFRDSSNNFFNGISGSSTWAFTILDQTAPVITNVATSSVATTTASITWTTNELASSKIIYSTGSTYTSSTTESDISPRVTSRIKTLTGLSSCTVYNYKVVSSDATGNYSTSTSSMFVTTGCAAPTLSATTTTASVSSTSTTSLIENGKTITVVTPPNFTATSSTVVIQIKGLDSETVFSTTSRPSGVNSAANIVFDVTALINGTTVLDSFDIPVTMSYTYSDGEIAGLEESSLAMYHYHNNAWIKLNDCSVNTTTNTIICTTPSFSIFGIFGSPVVVAQSKNTTSPGSSTKLGCKDTNASNYDYFSSSDPKLCRYENKIDTKISSVNSGAGKNIFQKNLKSGSVHEDVKLLQQLLNKKGYTVVKNGPGSINKETTTFGPATKKALIKFQKDNNINPAIGYFGPVTREFVNKMQ